MRRFIPRASWVILFNFFLISFSRAQLQWENVDSLFQPLPSSVHVYQSRTPIGGEPNIAYYVEADLKDRNLEFTVDTSYNRRLTPKDFYEKNGSPLLVVNATFFSFATNQNLNMVMRDGRLLAYNIHTNPGRGKDTFSFRHPWASAIGINKKREADIAWVYTDSSRKHAYAIQYPLAPVRNLSATWPFDSAAFYSSRLNGDGKGSGMQKWKMKTAIGGGPVLLQDGNVMISNNEELKFAGKAILDRHPRTAIGYTQNNKLIILVIEGRNPGLAEGATLEQEALIFKELGCLEAINLDGGGSSCMLLNGLETIRVSDKTGQRPVPAVFLIRVK